jgi:branched-chain amino acid transport system substrate-binding protein
MRLRALTRLMLLGLVLTACQTSPNSSTSNPVTDIVIASDMPISSPQNHDYILAIQQAIQLAISQHPDIAGFKLAYMPLDDALGDKASEEKGAQNLQQMIANPRVLGMIGPVNSNVAPVEIPIANAADLAMLSPSNTSDCLTLDAPFCNPKPSTLRVNGRNNYFRIAAPDSAQGRAMARFAVDTYNVKRVAALNEHQDFGALRIDSFGKELARTGGQLVLRQDLAMGTTDFTKFLAAAKAKGAEAIYAVGPPQASGTCAARAQMKGGGYFLVDDALAADPLCAKDAGDSAEGMVGTIPDVDLTLSSDAAAKTAVDAYRKAYPNTSDIGIDSFVFAAYDSALILIEAISEAIHGNQGRIPTRRQVLNAFATLHFKGVTGTYSFDANGDATSPPMSVYQVKNGAWMYLRPIDASP